MRGNKGATHRRGGRPHAPSIVAGVTGVEEFLDELRDPLKDRSFRPLPVRERMIPKAGGKLRRLGIATITDRVVQASLKLVLEPIFEADFLPCSYGFRPNRRAHDAVAEVRHFTSRSYEWVVEGDIKACFDEISHPALHGPGARSRRGQARPGPGEGVPQSGHPRRGRRAAGEQRRYSRRVAILSPLLSNVALSVLDELIAQHPGGPRRSNWNGRSAAVAVCPTSGWSGTPTTGAWWCTAPETDAEALREEIAAVLSTMGLRLSQEKTLITHIDEGLDFLGWRIQRHRKRGTGRHYVYTYPARKAVKAVTAQGEDAVPTDGHEPAARCPAAPAQPDAAGLVRLLPARGVQRDLRLPQLLRVAPGRADGCAANTAGPPWKDLRRRYCVGGWWPATEERHCSTRPR